ncbi:MAG TPA: glycosyltransferase family 39 protein [Acidobacteriota bacterium]|nr:glycosyltransferase family 39 protein [Acidobacteriota bacterium]
MVRITVKEVMVTVARKLYGWAKSPILIFAAAVTWILYAFQSYLPTLFPTRPPDFWLRRTGAYDILLVLWFGAVAYCAGKRFLRRIGVAAAAGAEETAFSIAAGAMMFSWATMILSLTHGLYRPVAYAMLLVPTAVWNRELRRLPGIVFRALLSGIRSLSWTASGMGRGFLAVYVTASLGVILISALGPSFEYDDLVYHLTGPKNFILAHKLVALPDVPMALFPKNIEMLHTLAMLLHCDITVKLLVFLCGCAVMIGVFGFSVRFVSRTTGAIAVAILASSPLFIWEMRTAHNDIGLTLFLFAGTYATAIWLRTDEVQWFRLACLFFAFSLGAKYWALPALGIVVSLVFIIRLLQSRTMRPALSAAWKLGMYSSLGLIPWGLVNLYYTGNPVYPLLNGIFRSQYWTDAHTSMALGEMFQGGVRTTLSNWWDIFRLPWEMMVDSHGRFGGNIGPWYVIFIPFLLFFPGMGLELGFIFTSGVLYYIGWAISGPWTRFLLPALPGLAAGAAFAISSLLRVIGSPRRTLAIIAAIFLTVLAVLASPYFEAEGSWSRYGNSPIFTLPFKYLSGGESKSDFLGRFYRGYRAVEYLNQIPGEKKVLYVHTLPDGFYLNGKAAFHYSPYVPGLFEADADRIHAVLRQHGITHVVVAQPYQESSPLSSRESEFTHRYLPKLFQRNASIVYELLPAGVDQTVVMYDFMDHLDEMDAIRKQPGTTGSAFKAVRPIGDDSRYVMVTVPPSEVSFPVTIPDHATLSFAAAREDPGYTGKGTLQVWIATSDEDRRLVYSSDLEGKISSWIENQVDLSEYAGRRVGVVLKTTEASPCCNYFWADPVLTAPSCVSRPNETRQARGKPGPRPVVLGGIATPATVRLGDTFEVEFSGRSLTSDLYFDIRFMAPQVPGNQVAFNWQYGSFHRHSIAPTTTPGKWIITGVRAHRDPQDHNGEFNPVTIPLEVTR